MEVKHIKHILCIFFLNVLRSIISSSKKDPLQFFLKSSTGLDIVAFPILGVPFYQQGGELK